MGKYQFLTLAASGLISLSMCRADIVVNYGPPPGCPPCEIGTDGQPDLLNPGNPGPAQDFTLPSQVDLTGITFWTYEEPGTWNLPVAWSIKDMAGNTVDSGTSSTVDTPIMTPVLDQIGFALQLSKISINLAGPITVGDTSGPENYSLNLKFILPSDPSGTLFYWAQGTNDHVAFQITANGNSNPDSPTVPEPSYTWFLAGGLGTVTALRLRKKR
jgi:hypothetical protein